MATDPNTPRPDDQHQDVRLYLLLLTLLVGLVIVAGTVYLSYQHPKLAAPVQAGGSVAAVLAACGAIAIKRR